VPHTPFSPGEPVSPREDEPRWFEPVAPDAIIEPTDQEDDWPAAAESARTRDPIAWRDVHWVEFGDADGAHENREDTTAVALDRWSTTPAASRDAPAPDPTEEGAAEQSATLRGRFAAGIARLLRLGGVAVSLVVAAIFLYKGGEMLAGFAGATTPPAALPEAARQPQTATVATPDRLPTPGGATAAPADPVDPRVAGFLVGARAGKPVAQYNLAVLYALGDGVAQDYASAASWFRKAAESGHPAAQFNLAVMYERGLGLPADAEAAFAWYRRAAERSYPAAEYNLALAYAEGRGTRADPNAAARWYHDAAVQGVVPAMVNVAILYETGEGIARSLPDAYAWYRAAARRGDAAAGERALELFHTFSGADKAQAVLMAAAVAEAMLEPAPAPPPLLPAASALAPSGPQPTVLKPAPRKNNGAARDAVAARRQPAG
jgi:TPR repeat protein